MKDKAQSASSVNTNQDKYEEKVMLLQLRGVLDYEAVKRAAQNGAIRVREADTETPLVQVGSSFYSGEWTETLGTDMIFSINSDAIDKSKMEFVAVSDTRLSTKKVLLSKDDDTKTNCSIDLGNNAG
uniref:Transcription factor TFIIIC triple barrel domain-containing protein n=1 Tax=Meloidogyne incognita TaxID=6306 RepID=A0A914MKS4_MELIC